MRNSSLFFLLSLSLMLFSSTALAQNSSLKELKSIYIAEEKFELYQNRENKEENWPDCHIKDDQMDQFKTTFINSLKKNLESAGFILTDDPLNADGYMTGSLEIKWTDCGTGSGREFLLNGNDYDLYVRAIVTNKVGAKIWKTPIMQGDSFVLRKTREIQKKAKWLAEKLKKDKAKAK